MATRQISSIVISRQIVTTVQRMSIPVSWWRTALMSGFWPRLKTTTTFHFQTQLSMPRTKVQKKVPSSLSSSSSPLSSPLSLLTVLGTNVPAVIIVNVIMLWVFKFTSTDMVQHPAIAKISHWQIFFACNNITSSYLAIYSQSNNGLVKSQTGPFADSSVHRNMNLMENWNQIILKTLFFNLQFVTWPVCESTDRDLSSHTVALQLVLKYSFFTHTVRRCRRWVTETTIDSICCDVPRLTKFTQTATQIVVSSVTTNAARLIKQSTKQIWIPRRKFAVGRNVTAQSRQVRWFDATRIGQQRSRMKRQNLRIQSKLPHQKTTQLSTNKINTLSNVLENNKTIK